MTTAAGIPIFNAFDREAHVENAKPMEHAGLDDSMVHWVTGAVLSIILAGFAFLARWVFKGVFERLEQLAKESREGLQLVAADSRTANEKVIAEMRLISTTVQGHETQLALLQQKFGAIEKQLETLEKLTEARHRRRGGSD